MRSFVRSCSSTRWGDSNLYLRRSGDLITLSVEHRAAPSIADLNLRLADGARLAIQPQTDATREADAPATLSPAERIERHLAKAAHPVPLTDLRSACRIRTATLCHALAALADAGKIAKTESGYVLCAR